jgi:hypothetical protein
MARWLTSDQVHALLLRVREVPVTAWALEELETWFESTEWLMM